MEGAESAIGTAATIPSAAFARTRPWRLFALVFASMIAAVVVCMPVFGEDAPPTLYVATLLGLYAPALLWMRHHLRGAGVSAPDYLGDGPTLRDLGPGTLLVLSLVALAVADAFLGAELVASFDRDLLESLYGVEASPAEPYGTPARMLVAAIVFFTIAVAAPVAEELVFRGALVDAWRSRWGLTRAWVASAALFAILHGAAAPSTFVFALVMSAARQWSGGLWLPIALHAANNFLPGIAEVLALVSNGQSAAHAADSGLDRVGLGLLLLVLGLPLPLRVIRRAWASAKAERKEDRRLAAS